MKILGRLVWDPRAEAWVRSDNPALVLADAYRRVYGFRMVDWDSFATLADVCDQKVPGPLPEIENYGPLKEVG